MKKTVFSLLSILVLALPGCIKEGSNIDSYTQVAAIVGSDSYEPVLLTPYVLLSPGGIMLAPELEKKYPDLMYGDPIIVGFTIDKENQPSTKYKTVTGLTVHETVTRGWNMHPTPNGEDTTAGFDTPIEDMVPYALIDKTLFFKFLHTAPRDQKFEYEMTWPEELPEGATYPTLYLRAVKSGNDGTQVKEPFVYYYVFDMDRFFTQYMDAVTRKVQFAIKYKTGVDEAGKDVYKEWMDDYGNKTITVQLPESE